LAHQPAAARPVHAVVATLNVAIMAVFHNYQLDITTVGRFSLVAVADGLAKVTAVGCLAKVARGS
jgi:hypothetical protein